MPKEGLSFRSADNTRGRAKVPLTGGVYNHSEKKGHVPNQSLYKGWKQSFPSFCHDQKMDIISCQDGQFKKCRNEIIYLLVRF